MPTPVDDAGQPTILDQAVAFQVSVDPDRRALVRSRSECLLPHRDGSGGIDQVTCPICRRSQEFLGEIVGHGVGVEVRYLDVALGGV